MRRNGAMPAVIRAGHCAQSAMAKAGPICTAGLALTTRGSNLPSHGSPSRLHCSSLLPFWPRNGPDGPSWALQHVPPSGACPCMAEAQIPACPPRGLVVGAADAVAAVFAHDAEAFPAGHRFDRMADVTQGRAGPHLADAGTQGLAGALDQSPGLRARSAHVEHPARVAEPAAVLYGTVPCTPTMCSWQRRSSVSVLMPGTTCGPIMASTSAASLPASRAWFRSCADLSEMVRAISVCLAPRRWAPGMRPYRRRWRRPVRLRVRCGPAIGRSAGGPGRGAARSACRCASSAPPGH